MMRCFLSMAFVCAMLAAPAQGAFVPPFGPAGGGPLQGVLDGITVAPTPGASSVNVLTDGVEDARDSVWQVNGGTGSVSTIVAELAGFADDNKFGIYDSTDPSKMVEIFDGPDAPGTIPPASATLQILGDGSVLLDGADTGIDFADNSFGYYLDSSANAGGGVWFSDSSLNSDGTDHMAAYRGVGDTIDVPPLIPGPWNQNQYMLAFEDLDLGSAGLGGPAYDGDFTDFVVLVESVSPKIPEPASIMTWLGLFGVIGMARFRKSAKR